MKSIYHIGLVIGLFLLITFLRTFNISSIPPVISHDEIYYPTQAKTILLSGSDPSGNWSPLSLTAADPLFAELPGLVMTPGFILFPDQPLLAARFSSMVLGTLLILSLSYIVYKFTDSKTAAYGTFLIGLFNPWIFQFSRMGFDSLFSLSLLFSGFAVLLATKKHWQLLTLPIFILAFYQYQGHKLIFLPVVLGFLYYKWKKYNLKINSDDFKTLSIIAAVSSLVLAIFLGKTFLNPDQQRVQSDLVFSNQSKIEALVNEERQQAIKSPINSYFINKGTITLKLMGREYLNTFNPNYLLLSGEPLRNPFSVWRWGMFLPLDFILIFVGMAALIKSKPKKLEKNLLIWLILVAPIPSALNSTGTWVMFRSSLIVPTFIILMGIGLGYLYDKASKYLFLGLLTLYLVFVAAFLHDYFFKYPVYGTQGKYFANRVIASYINRVDQSEKVEVLAVEPKFAYQSYLTLGNKINRSTINEIQKSYNDNVYTLDNAIFNNHCLMEPEESILIADAVIPLCDSAEISADLLNSKIAIPSLLDSGAIYHLYNDNLCSGYDLNRFANVSENVFDVESLSNEEFCKNFFIRL